MMFGLLRLFQRHPLKSLFSANSLSLCRFSDVTKSIPLLNFAHLAERLDSIARTNSRNQCILQMEELLADYLNLNDEEIFIGVVRMLSSKEAETNDSYMLASQQLRDILLQTFSAAESEEKDRQLFREGDIGEVAAQLMINYQVNLRQNNTFLSLKYTIDFLRDIGGLSGEGSRQAKHTLVCDFLRRTSNPLEAQYITKILAKNLRIGVSNKSLAKALANVNEKTNLRHQKVFRRVENEVLGYSAGLTPSSESKIGKPIRPMTAKALSSLEEVKTFFQKFKSQKVSVELKYDGERIQIHYERNTSTIQLYSRNLESQNERNPELVRSLSAYFNSIYNLSSCILDGELLLMDGKRIVSFQEQSNRPRKPDENLPSLNTFSANVYLFDAIMINGDDFMRKDQETRKKAMERILPVKGPIAYAQSTVLDLNVEKDFKELERTLVEYIEQSEEGVMVKSLDGSTYYDTEGKRQWAKLKKQVLSGGIADTLDVVPIAAYYGEGKRSGKFGAYLLGCFDETTEEYIAICKIGTGFTDEFMESAMERLKKNGVETKPKEYRVHRQFKPDLWLEYPPSEVWEISADCFSQSPIYQIGSTQWQPKGISLRFPRFHRVREDKGVQQATTTQAVIDLFNTQENKKKQTKDIPSSNAPQTNGEE